MYTRGTHEAVGAAPRVLDGIKTYTMPTGRAACLSRGHIKAV